MISTGLARAARALPTHASAPTAKPSALVLGAHHHAPHPPRVPTQRRLSSSKASCPPGGERSVGPRAAASSAKTPVGGKPAADAAAAPARAAAGRQAGARAGRGRRAREQSWDAGKQAVAKPKSLFDGLPSVPNINSIPESDIKLSSLFALHRPLTLSSPIPQEIEQHVFDRLFEPLQPVKTTAADVLSTLQSTIDNLDPARADEGPEWRRIEEYRTAKTSEDVRHLDGLPQRTGAPRSAEELVAKLKPYELPPPPKPMSVQQQKRTATRNATAAAPRQAPSTTTEYEATMILRDHGQEYYTAELTSLTPYNGVPASTRPKRSPPAAPQQRQPRPPYGRRHRICTVMAGTLPALPSPRPRRRTMLLRQRGVLLTRGGAAMQLLSVRRQRRLKMKKHKYKKLMKRTRTLRRKLEK